MSKSIYLIGSLRNPEIPKIASSLREKGFDVFDDWYAAGPTADDCWRDYEKSRGHSLEQALGGYAAKHVFEYDRFHLQRCDAAVLVLPAGKSGHLELGYAIGLGKAGYIVLDNQPERFDVMYGFATVVASTEELINKLRDPCDNPKLDGAVWVSAKGLEPSSLFTGKFRDNGRY